MLLSQARPQLGFSKNRMPVAALPLPVSTVRALVPDRASEWPTCLGLDAADYLLVFLRAAGPGGGWQVMKPGQVEAAVAAHSAMVATAAAAAAERNARRAGDEANYLGEIPETHASTTPVPGLPPLRAALMLPCWMAVQGAFPLNGRSRSSTRIPHASHPYEAPSIPIQAPTSKPTRCSSTR